MAEIGAPSSIPAQRQGGAANCKETPPPDPYFFPDPHGVGLFMLNDASVDWSTHRLSQKLCTVHDRLGDIGRLSKKAKY